MSLKDKGVKYQIFSLTELIDWLKFVVQWTVSYWSWSFGEEESLTKMHSKMVSSKTKLVNDQRNYRFPQSFERSILLVLRAKGCV